MEEVTFDKADQGRDEPPLYQQIMTQVRAMVADGRLVPGDRRRNELPNEKAIAEQTGASTMSVRGALERLAQVGEVVKTSGHRARVAPPWEPELMDPAEAGAQWGEDITVLVDETGEASTAEAALLQCTPGALIHRWQGVDYWRIEPKRMRTSLLLLDGTVDEDDIEPGMVTGDPLVDAADLDLAELQGWVDQYGARAGSVSEREHLIMDQEISVMECRRVFYDVEGETPAVQRVVWAGSQYAMSVGFDLD